MAGDTQIRTERPVLRDERDAEQLVLDVLGRHADSLLKTARNHSLCADDAHDAYQRMVEIFLRRAPTLEADLAHKWVHTVVKHEAMRVRESRLRLVGGEDADLDDRESDVLRTDDEHVASFDLMARSAEALQQLKPAELRALWLRAQGHSYAEIAELCDWSYTKVNRSITEGRRSFLSRFSDIGTGAECRRWEPVLSALVDGEATAKDLAGVRPHLRNCPACRQHVRALRESSAGLSALLPVPALLAGGGEGTSESGFLTRMVEAVTGPLHERVALAAGKLQSGVEAALPGKLATVAVSAAAVAGGGVAVERAVTAAGGDRPAVHREASAGSVASGRAASGAGSSAGVATGAGATGADAAARSAAARAAAARAAEAAAARRAAELRAARRRAAARTRNREFAARRAKAHTASSSTTTASREFAAAPTSSARTAAAPPPPTQVNVAAPPHATKDEQTAAAEFGGG